MPKPVSWRRDGRIGLIEIDNPPVNAAGQDVRAGLIHAIEALETQQNAEVIAIFGAGRAFIAGADIREFGAPPKTPWLPEVCNRIEACAKPVITVLHGAALGGGLEVAMAAHVRVALDGVKLGLPEVTLGILPGAGGTQRTPRLIGVGAALDLIVSGQPIGAQQALELGLIDRIEDGPPEHAARAAAEAVLNGSLAPRRTGKLPLSADPEAIVRKRREVARTSAHLFAPARCIDAVEAANLPLKEGLRRERALFEACLKSPQRAGLIHAFFAERAVAKIPEADAKAQPIGKIGVVGGGTMGRGIAAACLIAGLDVSLVDPAPDARHAAKADLLRMLEGARKRGKLADPDKVLARMQLSGALSDLAGADLVIEAAPEDLALKQRLFAQLDTLLDPQVILATNTSYLDLIALAAATDRPDRVLGLHFFAPAHVMRLLEVVVGQATAPETVATGFALAKRLRKIAVRAGVCDGFIGNRILAATRRAADEAVLMGATPQDVDAALERFGLAMGPYAAQDLSGLDIGAAGRAARSEAALVADALIARGDLGRKTGAGFYAYDDGTRTDNPALSGILEGARATAGLSQKKPAAHEIVARYMAAMVAEGCRIVEEGIALRAIDVDAVMLFGYGFPRHKGGPMHYADTFGLNALIAQIEHFAEINPALWSVPDLLRAAAEKNARLIG